MNLNFFIGRKLWEIKNITKIMGDKTHRRASRAIALKALFSFLARDKVISIEDSFRHVLKTETKKEDPFAWELVEMALENFGKIKVIIRAFAPEYAFDKIARINQALLVLGIVEMKFIQTPPIVVINEYIELSKTFGLETSAGFVNGVLDHYREEIEKKG